MEEVQYHLAREMLFTSYQSNQILEEYPKDEVNPIADLWGSHFTDVNCHQAPR
jgi:hypothetical protein